MDNRKFYLHSGENIEVKRCLKAILRITSGLFWLILMLGFSDFKMTVFTLIAALLHECGHILMLILLKKDFSLPVLVSSGFRIKTRSLLSYKDEILICAGGPVANVILFVLFIRPMPVFAVISLATAVSNLLPLPEYDGYKIISDVLALTFGSDFSDKAMPHITLTVSSTVVFLSLFMILIFNGGYWIFTIFFIVFLRQILFFEKRTKSEEL